LTDQGASYTGSGIGKACSLGFAKEGASGVTVADMNLSAARQVALECAAVARNPNFKSGAIEMDVTKDESVRGAVARVLGSAGRIDYGVNCAGVSDTS
jgi:NAD(P)-dependent dehydrogenase (short-subunit alcohol dehydrogenase family)